MSNLIVTSEMTEGQKIGALEDFIKDFGMGFHPDNAASDYIAFCIDDMEVVVPVLSESEALIYDNSIKVLLDTFGNEIYSITLAIFNTIYGGE